MKNKLNNLTPREAWAIHGIEETSPHKDDAVEFFISNFKLEGITDIKDMCERYVKDLPIFYDTLFTQEQLDKIACLLEQYINDYIEGKGGYEKLKLYSEKEINSIDIKQMNDLSNVYNWFKNKIKNRNKQ